MNPLITRRYAEPYPHRAPEPLAPPPVPDAAQQRATAYDRNYIAAHAHAAHNHPNLVTYDRTPLPHEWRGLLPSGAFVRVFVINDRTTVRVLHTAMGQRMEEPVIDRWSGDEDASVAS